MIDHLDHTSAGTMANRPQLRTNGYAHAGARPAGDATRRHSLRFPPRLEIAPLTIRPAADGSHGDRLSVH